MRTPKVTISDGDVTISGERTTPHSDGNKGRHVYISGKYVLKLDDQGYNHQDMAVWRNIKRADRKYFVPCLAEGVTEGGIRWSLQPYVELSWEVTEEAREIIGRLYEKYGLQDIDYYAGGRPRNWAINAETGEPIIFDYGLD